MELFERLVNMEANPMTKQGLRKSHLFGLLLNVQTQDHSPENLNLNVFQTYRDSVGVLV